MSFLTLTRDPKRKPDHIDHVINYISGNRSKRDLKEEVTIIKY
jgi:hypothetical protein